MSIIWNYALRLKRTLLLCPCHQSQVRASILILPVDLGHCERNIWEALDMLLRRVALTAHRPTEKKNRKLRFYRVIWLLGGPVRRLQHKGRQLIWSNTGAFNPAEACLPHPSVADQGGATNIVLQERGPSSNSNQLVSVGLESFGSLGKDYLSFWTQWTQQGLKNCHLQEVSVTMKRRLHHRSAPLLSRNAGWT